MNPIRTQGGLESLVAQVSDKFLEALERGEHPDPAELAARFPEHAATLRQVLSSLEALQLQAQDAGGETLSGCLGDFRILREIGRGGMGIVYEAEQISLARRVALKVLPFAAALDAKQLQRFRNEAHAAACLHHQNIVPVYSVGYERGVHYYAMQFIDGHTVAAMIHELRREAGKEPGAPRGLEAASASTAALAQQPTLEEASLAPGSPRTLGLCRTIARLGVQAAEALEHAHQLGVVHRDVKPANLLIDPTGNLWITDFGLARAHGAPALTMTGDLVGTLRYMSPEQALAQRGPVDHRADIYSLGVTLYELLALEPAFDGKDRHELLRQIAEHTPRPLRRHHPAVPPELETIVHKALARSPEERYASAQELAEDLERFLQDKPILARRPTFRQRLRGWTRRHRAAVAYGGAAAATTLIAAAALLTVNEVRLSREQARTRAALAAVQQNFRAVEYQRERAEANFGKALEGVDRLLARASGGYQGVAEENEPIRRALLRDALRFYQDFVQEHQDDAQARYESGWAFERMGAAYAELGKPADAEHAERRALALLEAVAADRPQPVRYRRELARCCELLGELLRQLPGRYAEASALFHRAIHLSDALVAEAPASAEYQADLASELSSLGYLEGMRGRWNESLESMHRAEALLEGLAAREPDSYRQARAACANSRGLMLRLSGQPRDAEKAHRQALALLTKPDGGALSPGEEMERARAWAHLGIALARLGRREEAEKAIRQNLAVRESLLNAAPGSQSYRQETALTYRALARLLEAGGRRADAERAYRRALGTLEALAKNAPDQADFHRNLALVRYALGQLLEVEGQAEADELFAASARAFAEALTLTPDSPETNNNFAWCLATCPRRAQRDGARAVALARRATELTPEQGTFWNTLGVALYCADDAGAAIAALNQSMSLRGGGDPFDWLFLALCHQRRGDAREALRWYERSVKWLDERPTRDLELARFRAEAAAALGR